MAESLIPYLKSSKRRLSIKKILPPGIKTVPIIFFISFVLIVYAGTFVLRITLNNKLNGLRTESEELSAFVQSKDAKEVERFVSRISALNKNIEEHIYSSQLFEPFETLTHKNVTINAFSWTLTESAIKIDGVTGSFETLGEQFLIWKNNIDFVQDIELVSFDKTSEGQVAFSAIINVKSSIVHKTNSN